MYRGKYDENNGYGKLKASDNGHALIEATNSPILIAKDTIGVPSTTGTVDHSVYPTTHHEEYRKAYKWFAKGNYWEIAHGNSSNVLSYLYKSIILLWWILSLCILVYITIQVLK